MKKLLIVVCLLFPLLLFAAQADQTVQTDHFEADLPGEWISLGAMYLSSEKAVLDFEEFPFEGYSEASMDANSEVIVTLFAEGFVKNMADYGDNLRSEPLEVAGKPSALITFTNISGRDQYVACTWGEEVIGYMVYLDLYGDTPMDDFVNILSSLRKKDDTKAAVGDNAAAKKEVTVPAGEWVVGKDIPAGEYSIKYGGRYSNGGISFVVWRRAVSEYSNHGLICNQVVSNASPIGKLSLEDGNIVVIKNGPAVFGPPVSLGF